MDIQPVLVALSLMEDSAEKLLKNATHAEAADRYKAVLDVVRNARKALGGE